MTEEKEQTKENVIIKYLEVERDLLQERVKEHQYTLKKDSELIRKIDILEEKLSLLQRLIKVSSSLIE